jgi:hypothetical protein
LPLLDDIAKLQAEVLETADLAPVRASQILVELTALYFTVTTELRESEFVYNQIEAAHPVRGWDRQSREGQGETDRGIQSLADVARHGADDAGTDSEPEEVHDGDV